jgi:hypothetical protein
MYQTTIRVARPIRTNAGALIKMEVAGEWFVRTEEWPKSGKADQVRRVLADCQSEEPNVGWCLQSRGTETSWHTME